MSRVISIILPLFASTVVESVNPVGSCPDGTLEAPNHVCFNFFSDRRTFPDAESSCFSLGGHLAVVDSLFTNTFLADLDSDDFWIGAHVYTNLACQPWVWTDNKKLVAYSDWANGEPSGGETSGSSCAAASVLDGTWSAVDCSSAKPYVCEVPRVISSCPDQWISFKLTKSCYKVFFNATWQDGENFCRMQNAHLTSIHSQEESNFIINIAGSGEDKGDPNEWIGQTWIGLSTDQNDNSGWTWTDDSVVDYLNWNIAQPDFITTDKCVFLVTDRIVGTNSNHGFGFENSRCNNVLRNYVCKKPATLLNIN